MSLTLAQKLKIKSGDTLLTLHAPGQFKKMLGELPGDVTVSAVAKKYKQVHVFVKSKAEVNKEANRIVSLLAPDTLCWIYFPKGSSGIQTDLSRDKGWDTLFNQNKKLVHLSLISFDDTWSAFAMRLDDNSTPSKPAPVKESPLKDYIDAATKTVKLPADLAAALTSKAAAKDFFNSLSYTNRKEYVEWIVTAKQEATRKSRVEGTVERLQKQWKNPRNI